MSSPAMTDCPLFEDRYISRSEIREKFGVSDPQLRMIENRPDWPRGVVIGRRKKYRGADLLKWLEDHQG